MELNISKAEQPSDELVSKAELGILMSQGGKLGSVRRFFFLNNLQFCILKLTHVANLHFFFFQANVI